MIAIHLNGQTKKFPTPLTIKELLRLSQIDMQAIAVAINSEIVPRSEFGKIRVKNQDQVEVIHAVGGG